jgi:hypothetical protein
MQLWLSSDNGRKLRSQSPLTPQIEIPIPIRNGVELLGPRLAIGKAQYVCYWPSMASEIERDLISQRTKEALAARKKAEMKLGRPKGVGKSKLDPYRPEIEALLNYGSTQTFIARHYGTTEANLSRWLKQHQIKRSMQQRA